MRAAPLALSVFPLTLIGILAAERSALLWLGANPGNALAWEFWLKAHAAFGRMWQALEPAFGGSVFSHLLGLFAAATLIVPIARARRWASYSFLTNHAALIVAIASSVMATQAKVSSLSAEFASPGYWALTWVAQFSPLQLLVLIGGAASCLLCHVAVLRHLHGRLSPVSLRVRMLQQNL